MFGVPQIQETPTMPLWGIGIRVTQVEGSYCPCWIQMGNTLQSSYEPIVGHAIRTSMNILKLYEMHFQSFLQKANTYFCRKWTVYWSIGKDHVCEAWLPRYPATRLWRFSLTSRGSCSHGLWTWRIYPQLWILHWNHEVLTYWICLGVPLKYSDKPNEIMSVIYAGQTQMTSVTLYIYINMCIYIYICIPLSSISALHPHKITVCKSLEYVDAKSSMKSHSNRHQILWKPYKHL